MSPGVPPQAHRQQFGIMALTSQGQMADGICKLHSPGLAGLGKVDSSARFGLGKVLGCRAWLPHGCSVDTRATSYCYRKYLTLFHSLPIILLVS